MYCIKCLIEKNYRKILVKRHCNVKVLYTLKQLDPVLLTKFTLIRYANHFTLNNFTNSSVI